MHEGDGGPLKVAMLGCGVVGSEVVRLFTEQAGDLAARVGRPLELAGIAVRRPGRARANLASTQPCSPTTPRGWPAARTSTSSSRSSAASSRPASLILTALEAGASVVTANKALLAEDGATLFTAADKHGGDLYYEAAVAGAIPLLRPLRESLAGDRVRRVLGIVNGTTNYILTRMTESGAGFAEALEEAQALGYAEADPTADVEGFDAAAKAAILAEHRLPHPGDRRRRPPRGHHRRHRAPTSPAPARWAASSSCWPSPRSRRTVWASASACTRR